MFLSKVLDKALVPAVLTILACVLGLYIEGIMIAAGF